MHEMVVTRFQIPLKLYMAGLHGKGFLIAFLKESVGRVAGQGKVCIEDHTTSFTNTVNTETDTEYLVTVPCIINCTLFVLVMM